jgi:hypothetical protein
MDRLDSLLDIIDQGESRYGDRFAFGMRSDDGLTEHWTYRELNRRRALSKLSFSPTRTSANPEITSFGARSRSRLEATLQRACSNHPRTGRAECSPILASLSTGRPRRRLRRPDRAASQQQ